MTMTSRQQTQPTTQHQQRYGCSTIPCLECWKGEAPNLEPFTQFSLKEVSAQPDGKRGEVIDRSDTGRRGDDILGSPEMFPFDNKAAQIEGSSGPRYVASKSPIADRYLTRCISKQLQHGLPETLRVNGHRIQKASGSTK